VNAFSHCQINNSLISKLDTGNQNLCDWKWRCEAVLFKSILYSNPSFSAGCTAYSF